MSKISTKSYSPRYENSSSSMRGSPIMQGCRCSQLESIKENLILAAETISQLRTENKTIKESLKLDYEEKIATLTKECKYLKAQISSFSNLQLKKEKYKQKFKNLVIEKEKIINFQQIKLKNIKISVTKQVEEVKILIEINNKLKSELESLKKENIELISQTYQKYFSLFELGRKKGLRLDARLNPNPSQGIQSLEDISNKFFPYFGKILESVRVVEDLKVTEKRIPVASLSKTVTISFLPKKNDTYNSLVQHEINFSGSENNIVEKENSLDLNSIENSSANKISDNAFSKLIHEGEELIKVVDFQSQKLSKLTKELNQELLATSRSENKISTERVSEESNAYENSFPSQVDDEIHQDLQQEFSSQISRKRSRWDTKANLRIPCEKEIENSPKYNFQTSPERLLDPKTVKSHENFDRFNEYSRPFMKFEENWNSVKDYFYKESSS